MIARTFLVSVLFVLPVQLAAPTAQPATADSMQIRVIVQGDTGRLPDFVESLRREFGERGMMLSLVDRGTEFDYNIVLAQETSMAGAAAAVVVLDRNAWFVTSVVRSGRWSGKGAFNATAKELAKKIAILRAVKEQR